MAANAYRGLLQLYAMLERNDPHWKGQLRGALDLSTWTEDIGLDNWRLLDFAVGIADPIQARYICLDKVMEILPGIAAQWVELDQPGTREQWYEQIYIARRTKVDGRSAVTGVINGNSLSGEFWDLETYEGIDPNEPEGDVEPDCYTPSTILVGAWEKDEDGKWDAAIYADHDFAAIYNVNEHTVQVVWSKDARWCHKCSPCYLGQGDLDTPRNGPGTDSYWAFDLPAEYKRGS